MANKNTNSQFKTGSGCFTCILCGKKTRSTGKHNYAFQDECDDCIDMSEHENSINDNTGSWSPEVLEKAVKTQAKMERDFEERCAKNGVKP